MGISRYDELPEDRAARLEHERETYEDMEDFRRHQEREERMYQGAALASQNVNPLCHVCNEPITGSIFHGCCGEETYNYCEDCHDGYRCHTDREDPREYRNQSATASPPASRGDGVDGAAGRPAEMTGTLPGFAESLIALRNLATARELRILPGPTQQAEDLNQARADWDVVEAALQDAPLDIWDSFQRLKGVYL